MTSVQTQPDIEIIDVTPEMAKEWLTGVHHNRKLRSANVNRYARDMDKGRWTFNGEPIQFDTNGTLINGQHRLNAILQSGTTQKFLVIRNLPPQAQETMDTGAKRTPGDVLSLSGYENSNQLAAVARLAMQIEASPSIVVMQRGYTTAELKARVESDPSLITTVQNVVPNLPKQNFIPGSVLAFCYYRLSQVNADKAREFFEGLLTLVNLPSGSPILALHRRLTALTATRNKSAQYQFEIIALVFQAWNAFRKGEERTMIKVAFDDSGRLRLSTPV